MSATSEQGADLPPLPPLPEPAYDPDTTVDEEDAGAWDHIQVREYAVAYARVAIEQDRARRQERPPGWISIDAQLPPRGTPVLALVGARGKKRPQRCAVLEYWTPGKDHSDDEPGWFEPATGDLSDFVWPVTHWMPLPEMLP